MWAAGIVEPVFVAGIRICRDHPIEIESILVGCLSVLPREDLENSKGSQRHHWHSESRTDLNLNGCGHRILKSGNCHHRILRGWPCYRIVFCHSSEWNQINGNVGRLQEKTVLHFVRDKLLCRKQGVAHLWNLSQLSTAMAKSTSRVARLAGIPKT